MTIDEAIKYLNDDLIGMPIRPPDRLDEAERLGIEALKRLQEGRRVDHAFAWHRLPGETEEVK